MNVTLSFSKSNFIKSFLVDAAKQSHRNDPFKRKDIMALKKSLLTAEETSWEQEQLLLTTSNCSLSHYAFPELSILGRCLDPPWKKI